MASRIINWLKTIRHINMLIEGLNNEVSNLRADILDNQFDRDFAKLIYNQEKLVQLKHFLSISPVIWGDTSRLEISEKAAVNACFFNTNSGRISIGDYTFAGSGVSILAGSHDTELSGYLRRDSEYKEGFDITIGKGVWLASNSTILGPCVIEDDAVIAAGAVVIPGTHIKRGELYAGIPAKKIKQIKTIDPLDNDINKLTEVINREGGVLFYSGWTDKKVIKKEENAYIGRWIDGLQAELYTCLDRVVLVVLTEKDRASEVRIFVEDALIDVVKIKQEPVCIEVPTSGTGKITKVRIETDTALFVTTGI